jgi:hypothetical protein
MFIISLRFRTTGTKAAPADLAFYIPVRTECICYINIKLEFPLYLRSNPSNSSQAEFDFDLLKLYLTVEILCIYELFFAFFL